MKHFINKVQLVVIIGLLSFVFGSQTYSQGYLTNVKVNDEALADGYGIICINVTEYGASPAPIYGATVTLWNYDTTYLCTTGLDACCWELLAGTSYTAMVEAEGYVSEICEGITVNEYPPIFVIEFQLYEFPYPALGVWAERNNAHTEVFVEWHEYSDFYQIVYDDNIADNVTAWQEAGNMNALRFTPAGYPAEVFMAQVSIFDGAWPPGNSLTPFQVAIYDDDGENGLPGTELAITTFTPFNYGWVDVDFSQYAISIPDGDFYVVMIQGGDFPDCAPIAIDESNPVYRSYSKNVSAGMPWEPADFADFMMRAFVYSEIDGAQILSYNDKIDIPESESQALSRFGSNVEPGTYDVGFGRFIPKGEVEDLRDFDHYEVWVLSEGDELEPELWTLKDDAVLETNYTDTDWLTYEQGFYRYAVVGTYSYNVSEPAFSNVLHSESLLLTLPFFEPWDYGFGEQDWSFDPEPGNWQINDCFGNPDPSAEFDWSPSITDYYFALQSIFLDGNEATENVTLEFDLYLSDYSSTGLEFLTVEVWDGTSWMFVDEFTNNGNIQWEHKSYNITMHALGVFFKVRFVAHGSNSYDINNWNIDNVFIHKIIMAGLEGYVTDEETGDPIEAAMIEVGSNLPVYTDEEGFYSVGVLESTYSVICSAEGYLPELIEEIFITGVISQDFALEMEACDPPLNLVAEVVYPSFFDVLLTWESPGSGSIDEWIHYDDGVQYTNIGLTAGGAWMVAVRFEPGQLTPYMGTLLTEISLFPMGFNTTYVLKVWTGANAANLIVDQPMNDLVIEQWNTVVLDTPVPIDISQELWFGYAVDQPVGDSPAGCDAGPAFAGYGDMITIDGVTWETLSGSGLNYNWNLQGHIVSLDGEAVALTPLSKTTFESSRGTGLIAGDVNTSLSIGAMNDDRSLLGYNVYRNDIQLNDSLVLTTSYLDEGLEVGWYEYYVTAVYTLCESEPSNVVYIGSPPGIDDLLVPKIKIYPIPATNFVNVEIPEGIHEIRMVNNLGDIVYMQNVEMEKSLRIRTGAYSSGIYLLEFIAENGSIITKRIIITK